MGRNIIDPVAALYYYKRGEWMPAAPQHGDATTPQIQMCYESRGRGVRTICMFTGANIFSKTFVTPQRNFRRQNVSNARPQNVA